MSDTMRGLDLLRDVDVTLTVELGRARLALKDVLALGVGVHLSDGVHSRDATLTLQVEDDAPATQEPVFAKRSLSWPPRFRTSGGCPIPWEARPRSAASAARR